MSTEDVEGLISCDQEFGTVEVLYVDGESIILTFRIHLKDTELSSQVLEETCQEAARGSLVTFQGQVTGNRHQ